MNWGLAIPFWGSIFAVVGYIIFALAPFFRESPRLPPVDVERGVIAASPSPSLLVSPTPDLAPTPTLLISSSGNFIFFLPSPTP